MRKLIAYGAALAVMALGAVPAFTKGTGEAGRVNASLELWCAAPAQVEGMRSLAAAYHRAYPGSRVTVLAASDDAALAERLSRKRLPDLMHLSPAQVRDYAAQGVLADLTPAPVLQQVPPAFVSAAVWQETVWALPFDVSAVGLIYNQSIFTRLRIAPPLSADALESAIRALQSKGVTPFAGNLQDEEAAGVFLSVVHTALLAQKDITPEEFITAMNDSRMTYNIVDTRALFSIIDSYRANMNPFADEMNATEQEESFTSEASALFVGQLSAYRRIRERNPDMDARFTPFPVYNDAAHNQTAASVDGCFAVSAQSSADKQQAAWQFLEWLATAEAQQVWADTCGIPLAFTDDDATPVTPERDMLQSVAQYGAQPLLYRQYPPPVFEHACALGMQQYLLRQKSADKVLADINTRWQRW